MKNQVKTCLFFSHLTVIVNLAQATLLKLSVFFFPTVFYFTVLLLNTLEYPYNWQIKWELLGLSSSLYVAYFQTAFYSHLLGYFHSRRKAAAPQIFSDHLFMILSWFSCLAPYSSCFYLLLSLVVTLFFRSLPLTLPLRTFGEI